MRSVKALLVVGMAVFLAGCPALSLQPLYTEQDLVFDPGLVGSWTDREGKDIWVLKRSGDKSYDAVFTEDGEAHAYKLYLLQLGVYRFLDITPKEELKFESDFFTYHWAPVHTFYRIRLEGDILQVALGVDREVLKPLIAAKKTRIAQLLGDGVVLTGSTKELQDYVLRYAQTEGASAPTEEYHRVK